MNGAHAGGEHPRHRTHPGQEPPTTSADAGRERDVDSPDAWREPPVTRIHAGQEHPGCRAATAAERLARAALTRVIEPGDERGGRWLRTYGAVDLLRRLTAPQGPEDDPPGASPARLDSHRRRAALADPERDLAAAATAGARFLIPGDEEWPSQLDDLADARPIGLWVRGHADLRIWALRSVAVVGARACTPTGPTWARSSAPGSPKKAGSSCPGRPPESTEPSIEASSPPGEPPSPCSPAESTSSTRAATPS